MTTAEAIAKLTDLGRHCTAIASEHEEPEAFARALAAGGREREALDVIALALTSQQAFDWGIECVETAVGHDAAPLDLVRAYNERPSEGRRLQVVDLLSVFEDDDPRRWLCQAVAWSGPSLNEPGEPVVAPPKHLPGVAIAAAAALALPHSLPMENAPDALKQRLTQFIERGLQRFAS